MIKSKLPVSWGSGLFYNPNQVKKYCIPTRLNDPHAWILPANFFIRSQDWTIVFELDVVRIYLGMDLGTNICLYKAMNCAEINQFEKQWLSFQSSQEDTFDLQGFNLLI